MKNKQKKEVSKYNIQKKKEKLQSQKAEYCKTPLRRKGRSGREGCLTVEYSCPRSIFSGVARGACKYPPPLVSFVEEEPRSTGVPCSGFKFILLIASVMLLKSPRFNFPGVGCNTRNKRRLKSGRKRRKRGRRRCMGTTKGIGDCMG